MKNINIKDVDIENNLSATRYTTRKELVEKTGLCDREIRKRIENWQTIRNEFIKETQITREEAEQLGDRREIDGVKLIVVDKLGDMTRTDCFAYTGKDKRECDILKKLYCKKGKCNFYKEKKLEK